jgi:hypothetical protein
MNYNIISKIEYINNQVEYTSIGYTTDTSLVDYIYNNYELIYDSWIDQNRSDLENDIIQVSDFFTQSVNIYSANHTTTSIDDMNLSEININDL